MCRHPERPHVPIGQHLTEKPEPNRLRTRTRTIALLSVLLSAITATAGFSQDAGGRVIPGGIERFVSNRWSLARGIFTNRSDKPATLTAVVTPPNSNGFQYARQVTIPADSTRTVQWPVYMPLTDTGLQELQFLIFPEGGEQTAMERRLETHDRIRTFTTNLRLTEYGHFGVMVSGQESFGYKSALQRLLARMLSLADRPPILQPVKPIEIAGSAHALDAMDQLCITNHELLEHPGAIEAIRIWVQRGGTLMICVDATGVDVANALLGQTMQLTEVDRTTENSFLLKLNPNYSPMRFRVREFEQNYAEPLAHVRTVVEGGEVIWSINGWPAAIRTNYGRGRVLVTTTSSRLFMESKSTPELIPSSDFFHDAMFAPIDDPLVTRQDAVDASARQIGYSIPGRSFAAAIVLGFPVLLLILGWWLRKRRRGELLIWCVPVLAILTCVPAAMRGFSSRTVAPQSVISQQVVRAIPGETQIVSDGFATLYTPDSGELSVRLSDGGVLHPEPDPNDRSYRRLMWRTSNSGQWQNLKLPVGMRTARVREVLQTDGHLKAVATLDEQGLTGTLSAGNFSEPADAVLASSAANRQAVTLSPDKSWTSRADGVLAEDEFFQDTILSEDQLHHAAVFSSIFSPKNRGSAFPNELSLLYWARSEPTGIRVGTEETRQDSSVLVVQPIQLLPPEAGRTITIPPVLLPFRSIADEEGGFGAAYNNNKRVWVERERGTEVNLEFDVPEVTLPLEIASSELKIRITAGSRNVEILAGDPDDMQSILTLEGRVGTFIAPLPARTIQRGQKLYVTIRVSDAIVAREEVDADEQDDTWAIENLTLTLQGARTE